MYIYYSVCCTLVTYRHVQYYAMIGGPSTLWDCGTPKSRDDDVIVEYSVNAGESILPYVCVNDAYRMVHGASVIVSQTSARYFAR